VSLVRLEFLTDDEDLIQLCTLYWQIDQEGVFACKVADLARNFGLSTNELSKRVKNSCKASSTAKFCDECKSAYVYSSRTDIQNLLRYPTHSWLCEDCTKKQEAREKAEQAAVILRKRQLVLEIFSLDQMEEIDVKTLALEDIVYLISFVRLGAAEDFSFIRPLGSITDLLSPRKHFDYDILKRLYRKGLICVHPNSDVDAFNFEGEDVESFKLDKVFWALPARINGSSTQELIAAAEDLLKTKEWPEVWCEEAYTLWKQIALEESLQYLEMVLEEHRLPFNPGEKTHLMFSQLLEQYSVAQAYNFIWRAAKDAAAFYQRGGVNKQHAANTVVGAIQRQAERALSEGWEVKAYRRDFRCPQSTISQVLFDTVLQMADIGFTQPPRVGAISKFSSNTADVD
jgi:hypothetical protein